jgi:outer membrane protein assembly factor BamD (BamD/ComL family)
MKSGSFPLNIFIVFLCGFLACLLLQGAVQAEEGRDHLTADSMKGFADDLFYREHFYRATVEYKRFLFFYPAHPDASQARFNIATAAQLVEDYPSALDYYRAFLAHFPHHPLAKKASRAIVEIESTLAGR